ncbi:nucleotide-diphospho-sugar transferase [Peniophora sp. CONT]|nr:nucleotide-diphospho-sugar transferase [Peniophora sp. CONT]
MSSTSNLRARYESAGQDHVFTFWEQLNEQERAALEAQLSALDIERVNRVFATSIKAENDAKSGKIPDEVKPLPADVSGSTLAHADKVPQWNKAGLDAVAAGRVGVLLMAGGQGTRLGSSAPKGCYDIGLPSHKTLFQLQAERIARLQTLAAQTANKPEGSVIVPWYIMTSGPTRKDTEAFFKQNGYFGLKSENIIFFEQGTLPCLTMDGKVILDAPSHVAVAPDGNGGVYAALRAPLAPGSSRTVLSDLESRGISYVHAYGVDNCLVRVADPVFFGYCISKQADCAAKVVPKAHAHESVGVIARRGDKFTVVEYSEISKEQAELKDEQGELAFRAANIVNHFYTTDFLKRVNSFEDNLAFHIARKKIPHVELSSGKNVKPTTPNGMKLELFVFDVFPFTERFGVLEVTRKDEFSPLKNAPGTGSDDPETSRRDLLAQHRRWIEKAGAKVEEGVEVEISPLASYAGEGLEALKGKTITRSGIVNSIEEFDALM